jgi:hypothetical protein
MAEVCYFEQPTERERQDVRCDQVPMVLAERSQIVQGSARGHQLSRFERMTCMMAHDHLRYQYSRLCDRSDSRRAGGAGAGNCSLAECTPHPASSCCKPSRSSATSPGVKRGYPSPKSERRLTPGALCYRYKRPIPKIFLWRLRR